MIQVIKLGGAILEDDHLRRQVLADFAKVQGQKLLIHGGGRDADQLATTLGVPVQKVEGRRVTDADTLRLVTMAFGGWLNKRIVTELQALGVNALGVSGADGNLVRSTRRPANPVDYGFVGDVVPQGVAAKQILQLMEAGFTPVFCALTHDGNGQLLNTNADTLASVIAQALAQEAPTSLSLCFEHAGVLTNPKDPDSWLKSMNPSDRDRMRELGQVSAGMLPKLEEGFKAKRAGAQRVWIKSANQLAEITGTELVVE